MSELDFGKISNITREISQNYTVHAYRQKFKDIFVECTNITQVLDYPYAYNEEGHAANLTKI